MPSSGPELPSWDVTGTNTRRCSRTTKTKSSTKKTVFDGSRTIGRQECLKRRSKRSSEIFVLRTKERVLGDKKMDFDSSRASIIHHRYNGRHVRTRDTERTESVEKFHRRRHVCVWEGGGGERKFSIKARSGVEGGLLSSSNWIFCIQVTNVSFLLGAIYCIPAEKRKGERGGREKHRGRRNTRK